MDKGRGQLTTLINKGVLNKLVADSKRNAYAHWQINPRPVH